MVETQAAQGDLRVVVGVGSCGIAAGALDVMEALTESLKEHQVDAQVEVTGCNGACHREPIVEVHGPGGDHWTYGSVTVEQVGELVEQHLVGGRARWKASSPSRSAWPCATAG